MKRNAVSFIQFVIRARSVHANRYQYEKDSYLGLELPLWMTCNGCNLRFQLRGSDHTALGLGCPECKWPEFLPAPIMLPEGETLPEVVVETAPEAAPEVVMEKSSSSESVPRVLLRLALEEVVAKAPVEPSVLPPPSPSPRPPPPRTPRKKEAAPPTPRKKEAAPSTPRKAAKTPSPAPSPRKATAASPRGMSTAERRFRTAMRNRVGEDLGLERAVYKGEYEPLEVTCYHGSFWQTPSRLIRGGDIHCPHTAQELGDAAILAYLEAQGIPYYRNHTFPDVTVGTKPLRFPYYLPTHNAVVEFDGIQHYNNVFNLSREKYHRQLYKDALRRRYCVDHGIALLRISHCALEEANDLLRDFLDAKK